MYHQKKNQIYRTTLKRNKSYKFPKTYKIENSIKSKNTTNLINRTKSAKMIPESNLLKKQNSQINFSKAKIVNINNPSNVNNKYENFHIKNKQNFRSVIFKKKNNYEKNGNLKKESYDEYFREMAMPLRKENFKSNYFFENKKNQEFKLKDDFLIKKSNFVFKNQNSIYEKNNLNKYIGISEKNITNQNFQIPQKNFKSKNYFSQRNSPNKYKQTIPSEYYNKKTNLYPKNSLQNEYFKSKNNKKIFTENFQNVSNPYNQRKSQTASNLYKNSLQIPNEYFKSKKNKNIYTENSQNYSNPYNLKKFQKKTSFELSKNPKNISNSLQNFQKKTSIGILKNSQKRNLMEKYNKKYNPNYINKERGIYSQSFSKLYNREKKYEKNNFVDVFLRKSQTRLNKSHFNQPEFLKTDFQADNYVSEGVGRQSVNAKSVFVGGSFNRNGFKY